MSLPCFADFESSGLHPDSYPIEVAWSLPDGRVDDRLILPDAEWTHWDYNAEAMHGISRSELARNGAPLGEVATDMNTALKGYVVYVDSVTQDQNWCDTLFNYADQSCEFKLEDIRSLFVHLGLSSNDVKRVHSIASKDFPRPAHRAANDVQRLQLWYVEAYELVRQREFGIVPFPRMTFQSRR